MFTDTAFKKKYLFCKLTKVVFRVKNLIVLPEKWHLFVNIHANFVLHEHKNEVYK